MFDCIKRAFYLNFLDESDTPSCHTRDPRDIFKKDIGGFKGFITFDNTGIKSTIVEFENFWNLEFVQCFLFKYTKERFTKV